MDRYEYTEHAAFVRKERRILDEWVHRALVAPDRVEHKPDGTDHYLKTIREFGDRWLRVVVNPNAEPRRIVTLFLDRRVRDTS